MKDIEIQFRSDYSISFRGFKIYFATSFDPGMLNDVSEIEYLDGLRILFQDMHQDIRTKTNTSILQFQGNICNCFLLTYYTLTT